MIEILKAKARAMHRAERPMKPLRKPQEPVSKAAGTAQEPGSKPLKLVPDSAKSKTYPEQNLPPYPEAKPLEIESKDRCFSLARENPEDQRVAFSGGRIELFNGLRSFWLGEFDGDEKGLELGLIQAAAFIQPNSARPLEAQVSAQLARQAQIKRNMDNRASKRATTRDGDFSRAEEALRAIKGVTQ